MEERWYVNPEVSGSSPGPVKVFFAIFGKSLGVIKVCFGVAYTRDASASCKVVTVETHSVISCNSIYDTGEDYSKTLTLICISKGKLIFRYSHVETFRGLVINE